MSRRAIIGLLIFSIGVFPRVPVPIFIQSRIFDLRVEDVLLAFCLPFVNWKELQFARLFKSYGVYLAVGAVTSILGMWVYGIDPARTTLYLMKEVEFGILGLLVANWVRTHEDFRSARRAILAAALANLVWVGVQIVTHDPKPLVVVESAAADTYYDPLTARYESYGPGLISEVGSFQTGQFFLATLLLAFAAVQYKRKFAYRWAYVLLSAAAAVAIVLSASRGAVIVAILGVGILAAIRRGRKWKGLVSTILILAIVGLILSLTGLTTPERFQSGMMEDSLMARIQSYWVPLVTNSFPGILIGFGKGSLGFVSSSSQEFAHNNYLRVLVESGVCGLLAFVWVLWRVVSFCWITQATTKRATTCAFAAATLAFTLARMTQAFMDDVFAGVLVTELWWVFVGLTVAAAQAEGLEEDAVPARRTAPARMSPLRTGGIA